MIYYKTQAEIELIRESCRIVGTAIAEAAKLLRPGLTTSYINLKVEELILDLKGSPSFKGYRGYPYASCISVNEAVVHGFPSSKELKPGDIISVDVGVLKNGYHGDSAYTFALGDPGKEVLQLMKVTKESLYKGIDKAIAGNRVGDISFAVQDYAEKQFGYGIVRELVGHGLGKSLHEDPQVANYGRRGTGAKLHQGLVIAIEPMVNLGTRDVYYDDDGWTVRTKDGKAAAHYEHTVCVDKLNAQILSSFVEIEKEEKRNANLYSCYY
ncbi:MAG TPA: type I methionyl aminopeptidase [Puia sp.]|nr:type I methionyl aminopeptidase [Puia sp.]